MIITMIKDFAERKALALLDAWYQATSPQDPKWRKMYAEAAIAAGLPCFDDATGIDLGVAGWQRWAAGG